MKNINFDKKKRDATKNVYGIARLSKRTGSTIRSRISVSRRYFVCQKIFSKPGKSAKQGVSYRQAQCTRIKRTVCPLHWAWTHLHDIFACMCLLKFKHFFFFLGIFNEVEKIFFIQIKNKAFLFIFFSKYKFI